MPGHIYAQTGRWEDAEEAFTQAAELERRYISQDSLYGTGHHGHNVHFLITTFMFERDYDRAHERRPRVNGDSRNARPEEEY